eukprot:COSAG06_NODE_7347_length_2536_cov_382.057037_2_plen_33_part_00
MLLPFRIYVKLGRSVLGTVSLHHSNIVWRGAI